MKKTKNAICFVMVLVFSLQLFALNISAAPKQTTADEIITIARSQIGWYKSDVNKFTTWFFGCKADVQWCNIFVSWCADQEGILGKSIPKNSACRETMIWFVEKGRFHSIKSSYIPQKGDLIFFDTWQPGVAHHIGFVSEGGYVKVNGKKCVRTVEGNTCDENFEGADYVSEKYRPVGDDKYKIMGYAHPAYGDNKIQKTPSKVEGLRVESVKSDSLKLFWDKLPGAKLYYYDISTDNENWKELGSVARAKVKIENLEPGTKYYFRVRGYNYGGFGKAAKVRALTAPGKVSGLSAKAVEEKSVTLRWDKVKSAVSYTLFGKAESAEEWVELRTTEKRSAKIKKLTSGESYEFKVFAENRSGAGESSDVFVVQTLFKPIVNLCVSKNGANEVSLSWDQVEGVKKYLVYVSENGKKWTRTGSALTNGASVSGLLPGKEYFFKVRAYTGERYGSYSEVINETTLPAAVEGLEIFSPGESSLKLRWNEAEGAERYAVFKSSDGSNWEKAGVTKRLKIKLTDLEAGTEYFFRVRAYNPSGHGKYSETVSAVL